MARGPTAVGALLPTIAFTVTGVLDQSDVNSLEWDIRILIGGDIALGSAFMSNTAAANLLVLTGVWVAA